MASFDNFDSQFFFTNTNKKGRTGPDVLTLKLVTHRFLGQQKKKKKFNIMNPNSTPKRKLDSCCIRHTS